MYRTLIGLALLVISVAIEAQDNPPARKQSSFFYPPAMIQKAVSNAATHPWAKDIQETIRTQAQPWLETSDERLWEMMFGPGITRSWMVWSDGFCPACKKDVRMYDWVISIWEHPFKVQCPHCSQLFPTNDFEAYFKTGLELDGSFNPAKADRKLLFNTAHPDPSDPLHQFGVDDGEGYTEGGKRWRFMGYFQVAGQWRRMVVGGARALSEAYVATGDPVYARKAMILLDRVADVFPNFIFKEQGLVYETSGHRGTVTTWHDACEEVRELAQAYDAVFDGVAGDQALIDFLSRKAAENQLANSKKSLADIRKNIEDRILRETLAHPDRIESNYPRTPISLLTIHAVLGEPESQARVDALFDEILKESLKEEGMTGEKGLAGYSTIFPRGISEVVLRFERGQPGFMERLCERYPQLYQTFRFHVDTWCLQKFYPEIGDSGGFGLPVAIYKGVDFNQGTLAPTGYQFLYHLYKIYKDPAFIQALYQANNNSTNGLPHDLLEENPALVQETVQKVIDQSGTTIPLGDVNKEEWGVSILRGGEGENSHAAWIDQDAGGRHGHFGGLNIGLFAWGLDLMPDFGYPPVGYGGWGAPKAVWYTRTAAHNTVVVDGKNHATGKGRATLWGSGEKVHLVRVSAPDLIQGATFERTLTSIELDDQRFLMFDVFRVCGGKDHARFLSSFYGKVTCEGWVPSVTAEYGFDTETRGFRMDPNPQASWSVDWAIDDRLKLASISHPIHLRLHELTQGAIPALGECWIAGGQFSGHEEWIPRLMVRRQSTDEPLTSTFISVIEPYAGRPTIRSVKRLDVSVGSSPARDEQAVAVQIETASGETVVYADAADRSDPAAPVCQLGNGMAVEARALVAVARDGKPARIALFDGKRFSSGHGEVSLKGIQPIFEIEKNTNETKILRGDPEGVEKMALE